MKGFNLTPVALAVLVLTRELTLARRIAQIAAMRARLQGGPGSTPLAGPAALVPGLHGGGSAAGAALQGVVEPGLAHELAQERGAAAVAADADVAVFHGGDSAAPGNLSPAPG